MFSSKRHINLKGGALYYVIFLVFVVSILSSLFILHRGIKLLQMREEIRYFERLDDLDSALALYFSDPDRFQRADTAHLVLFGDTTRSVFIQREPHGLLDIITIRAPYRNKDLSKCLLAGRSPFSGDSTVLHVPDRGQALFASGATVINGIAQLPVKGMQRASIEGRPLQRDRVIDGRITSSEAALPELAPSIMEKLKAACELESHTSTGSNILELYEASVANPFGEELRWYGTAENYQLSGIDAHGRMGFFSEGTIHIRKDAVLKGVLVAARNILVEDGFQGEVQLFARDSLVIGKECLLEFPSTACIYNDNVNQVCMEIGENTQVHGTVLVHQANLSCKDPYLLVKKGVEIRGQVYHHGKVELLGNIYGSLYCEGFIRKTKRAYYENHLLDNVIDFKRLPVRFVGVDLFQGYDDQIIEELETNL